MNKEKYYIPSVEEFHIGFECEYRTHLGADFGKWIKHKIDNLNIYNVIKLTTQGSVRVKYLDREDIESLGFECNNAEKGLYSLEDKRINLENPNAFLLNGKWVAYSDWELSYDSSSKEVSILDLDGVVRVNQIIVKNKSELVKVLKQVMGDEFIQITKKG